MHRAYATFKEPADAKQCVEQLNLHCVQGQQLRVTRGGVRPASDACLVDVLVKVWWATAPSRGEGIVTFASAAGANRALSQVYLQKGWKCKVFTARTRARVHMHLPSTNNTHTHRCMARLKRSWWI